MVKAWNGQEAVEAFEKSASGEFDVILMDVMMPVMNGYEATKTSAQWTEVTQRKYRSSQ